MKYKYSTGGSFSDSFYNALNSITKNYNNSNDYNYDNQPDNEIETDDSDEQAILEQLQSQTTEQVNDNFKDDSSTDDEDFMYNFLFNSDKLTGPAPIFQRKDNSVNINNTDDRLLKYLDTLPQNLKDKVLITSGNDFSGHATNSSHYSNKALDIRYSSDLHNYIKNDPTAKALGITTLDPNHGTAPHTHIQIREFGGDGGQSDPKKPIIVNNPNDPRLKAYRDSLALYNWNTDPNIKPMSSFPYDPGTNINSFASDTGNLPIGYSTGIQKIGGHDIDGIQVAYKKPVRPIQYQVHQDQPIVTPHPYQRLPNGTTVSTDINNQPQIGQAPQQLTGSTLPISPVTEGNYSATIGSNTQSFLNKNQFDAFVEAMRNEDNNPETLTRTDSSGSVLFKRASRKYKFGGKYKIKD